MILNTTTHILLNTFTYLAQSTSVCESTHSKNDRTNDVDHDMETSHTASIIGDNDVSVSDNTTTELSVYVKLAQNPYKCYSLSIYLN